MISAPNGVYVFDADGVSIHANGFANALKSQYGIAKPNTREFFAGPFRKCLNGQASLTDMLPPFLEVWRWPGTTREFIEVWMKSDDQPNSGVLDLVRKLRADGAKCYLASNQEAVRAAYIRKQMRFHEVFDDLYFSCDIGHQKPDRRFFAAVTERLSVPRSAICFWDDSIKYVRAAEAFGWNARLFTSIEALETDLHPRKISDRHEG